MSARRDRPAGLANFRAKADRAAALARYARLAPRYEDTTTRIREVHLHAPDLLALRLGETVFDVACGAGAILCDLSWRVGPRGRVFGVEQSPEMRARAIEASGDCDNVRVLCEPVETFRSPPWAARQSSAARTTCSRARRRWRTCSRSFVPAPAWSVAGLCLLPAWGTPVNAWVPWEARHYLTTWHGLRAPWVPLLEWFLDLSLVERYLWGTGYLAVGTVRSR